jgi:hypothetical protein
MDNGSGNPWEPAIGAWMLPRISRTSESFGGFLYVPAWYFVLMWRPSSCKHNQTSQDEKIDTVIGVVFFVLMAMLAAMLVAFLHKAILT